MTMTNIVIGLAIWTGVSIVFGLGLGAIMKDASRRAEALSQTPQRTPAHKSAA